VAAGINEGRLFRPVDKFGNVHGNQISVKAIWHIVKKSARQVGLPRVAPHDLRRTCARLCQSAGGELDQIQFLLGHVSIQTTERYLGSRQRLRSAVNDRIGIEPNLMASQAIAPPEYHAANSEHYIHQTNGVSVRQEASPG
jgi:integrase